MISFTVPGVPVAKGRPRTAVINGHAIVYTPTATRREEGAVRLIAETAMAGAPPFTGPVSVEISSYLRIPTSWSQIKQRRAAAGDLLPTSRPDIENLAKLAMDAMVAIVYRDDSQIVSAIFSKRYSVEPRTEVRVRPIIATIA